MKRREPEKLGDILNAVLAERGYWKQCREAAVLALWPAIVGEKIARVTVCDNVKNGVVYVKVSSAAWRNEIAYVKNEILKNIRAQTRCDTIIDIVFQ